MSALNDSGHRESFVTGMIREPNLDRGRYDLISPIALRGTMNEMPGVFVTHILNSDQEIYDEIFNRMLRYNEGYRDSELEIAAALMFMIYDRSESSAESNPFQCIPYSALRALAIHYERGAVKYAARNWELGGYISRYFNSAVRHLVQSKHKFIDEDHKCAFIWNCFSIIHTDEMIRRGVLPAELQDMPNYLSGDLT